MDIHVEMTQIDNGFTLSMYDNDGEPEYNKNVFVENLEVALKKIGGWADEIVEREANAEEAD